MQVQPLVYTGRSLYVLDHFEKEAGRT